MLRLTVPTYLPVSSGYFNKTIGRYRYLFNLANSKITHNFGCQYEIFFKKGLIFHAGSGYPGGETIAAPRPGS